MLMKRLKNVFHHEAKNHKAGELYVVEGKIEPVRYCQPTRWNPDFKITCDDQQCSHYASYLKGKLLFNGHTKSFEKLSRCRYPSNLDKERTLSILQSEIEGSEFFKTTI